MMKIKQFFGWFLDQWHIKILSLSVAVLLYFFTNLVDMKSASITLPLHYSLPNAMVQGQEFPPTVKLHVRGKSNSLEAIKAEDLEVYTDFSFVHDEGVYQSPVRIRSLNDSTILDTYEIELEPSVIQLKMEKIAYKEVPVKIRFDGDPRNGHEVLNYSVVPSRVKVSGPKSRMANLDFVETDSVELASRTSSFTQRVHVRSPSQLISVSNVETVEIKVDIRESSLPMVFSSIKVNVKGLDSHLEASLSSEVVRVQIESKSSILQFLGDETIGVYVDLSQISVPGTYDLPLVVELPNEVNLMDLTPGSITVTVKSISVTAPDGRPDEGSLNR